MTLLELSGEYRASAAALRERVLLLEHRLRGVDGDGRRLLEGRIRLLRAMGREARDPPFFGRIQADSSVLLIRFPPLQVL